MTSGQQDGTPWTSVGLIYNDSTFPPANTSVRMVARGSYKFPGGTLQATLRLQRRMVGGTTWTEIATITPPIAGTVVQGAFTITVPASTRGIQYRVEFPRSTIVGSTNPAYTNIITLYPGGRLTGVSVSASPNPLLVGQRTTLTVATAPASAPNTTTQLQRQRAPGQWTLAGSAMPVRNTPGTETFRAVATQTGNGAGGPFTSPEITVRWLPALAIDPIADITAYRGEAIPGSNQLPAATGGIAPLTYALAGLPRSLTFTATTRSIQPNTIPATTPLGAHALTYTVTDASGNTASQSFTLTIRDRLRMTTPPPYIGDIGVAIPAQPNMPAATGGRAPYTYQWTNLPSGVTGATAAGRPWYSGTPAEADSFSVTLTATDADGQTAPRLGSFVIDDLAAPNPTAVAGNAQVVVSWGAVPQATNYHIRYASHANIQTRGANAYSTPVLLASSALTHTIDQLTNGQPYRFQVRGLYGTWPGPWGGVDATPVSPTTPPAAPTLNGQPILIEGLPGATGSHTIVVTQTPATSPTPTFSYTYLPRETWLTLTGATLSYTLPTPTSYPLGPDASGNRYAQYDKLYQVASSTAGVARLQLPLTVRVTQPPTVAPPLVAADLSITAHEGDTAIGTLGFVNNQDGYGAPHTWTVAAAPTGFSVAGPNITWPRVPLAGQPHTLTYTVTDRLGQSDTGTITINVTALPRSFAIVGPDSISGRVGDPVPSGQVWYVVNAVGGVSWVTPTNLPPGITLTPELISGIRQWRASGTFGGIVTNRRTVFSATDTSVPPQTDAHTTTWNVTSSGAPSPEPGPRPGPGVAVPPTITIRPIGDIANMRYTDAEGRHYFYYYEQEPEFELIGDNLFTGGNPARGGQRFGYVYSMVINGGQSQVTQRDDDDGSITIIQDPYANLSFGWQEPLNWRAASGDKDNIQNSSSIQWTRIATATAHYRMPRSLRNGYGANTITNRMVQDNYRPATIRAANVTNGKFQNYRWTTGGGFPTLSGVRRILADKVKYTAQLISHRGAARFPVPLYIHDFTETPQYHNFGGGINNFYRYPQTDRERRNRNWNTTEDTDEVIVHWIPRPLVWDYILPTPLAVSHARSGSFTMPGASGGVPPYKYTLHGEPPPGLSISPSYIGADGVRISEESATPPVISGTVNSTGHGIFDLTLACVDSAERRGRRQMIRQSFRWTTSPP